VSDRILIVDPNPAWPALFEAERARLQSVLGDQLILIEHIGSTSIAGLVAKPIIDLIAAVPDLNEAHTLIELLRRAGYEYVSEFEAEMPERRYFRKRDARGERTHHLHIYDLPTFYARPERLFRDYVRMHPDVAQSYTQLKRALAEQLGHDRAAYTEAKTDFIQSVVARAFIHLNVTLEYGLDTQGDLVPQPGSTEQARFIIYRFGQGSARFFRAGTSSGLRTQLAVLPTAVVFDAPESVQAILASPSYWIGRSYTFTRAPDPCSFPDVAISFLNRADKKFVVKQNGEPVAWAWSVRQNDLTAELAVETLPAYRRRGYARQATSAWANAVLLSGRIPFYSHARDNQASDALAQSLKLTPYAEGAAFD
jgi:GrpB-like predicted nucleotidyltransferase (UPF0157 family)